MRSKINVSLQKIKQYDGLITLMSLFKNKDKIELQNTIFTVSLQAESKFRWS